MQIIETLASGRWHDRCAAAAVVIATTILAAAIAPAAADLVGQNPLLTRIDAPVTAFHHHFWRGVPGQNRPPAVQNRRSSGDDMMAIAGDRDLRSLAPGYCADRSKFSRYGGQTRACR